MENTTQNQHPGKNEDTNKNPLDKGKDYQQDDNKNEVDENGQKINWNDPEISEADNIEGRSPKNTGTPESEYTEDQSVKNEVPDDGRITALFDQDQNSATVHSSNADRTFGNEREEIESQDQKNNDDDQDAENSREEKNHNDQNGTTGQDLASEQAEENDSSSDDNLEEDNES